HLARTGAKILPGLCTGSCAASGRVVDRDVAGQRANNQICSRRSAPVGADPVCQLTAEVLTAEVMEAVTAVAAVLAEAGAQFAAVELSVFIAVESGELLFPLLLDLLDGDDAVAIDVEPAFHPVSPALYHLLEHIGFDFLAGERAVTILVCCLQIVELREL